MTGPEVGLLSVVVALVSVIGTSKVNGKNKFTKPDHETLCSARLKPLYDGMKIIQEDVKTLLLRK